MKPESSFGSARARRKAKAAQDIETAHRLWTARIQETMRDNNYSAEAALFSVSVEVRKLAETAQPQRKAQILSAWSSYFRKVQEAKKLSP